MNSSHIEALCNRSPHKGILIYKHFNYIKQPKPFQTSQNRRSYVFKALKDPICLLFFHKTDQIGPYFFYPNLCVSFLKVIFNLFADCVLFYNFFLFEKMARFFLISHKV